MKRRWKPFVSMIALSLAATMFADPSESGREVDVTIADLGFIEGRWHTELGGDRLEEVWSEPTGDSMMGMFRWIKDGKVWMWELLTIREEGADIIFRFRHFSDVLVPWEQKDEPLTFKLVDFEPGRAVFENPGKDSPRRISFIKREGEGLRVQLQGVKDGKLGEGDIFDYSGSDTKK